MKRMGWIGIVASLLLVLSSGRAEAQLHIGTQLLHNEEVTDGSMGFGARASVPVSGFAITGDLTWYFPRCGGGSCSYWEALLATEYTFSPERIVSPYLGGGVGFQRSTVGLTVGEDTPRHVRGGIRLNGLGAGSPYLELSYRDGDELGDQVVVSLGVLF